MTRIKTLTFRAIATFDQRWLAIQARRNGPGKHRLENTLYYGHSAASIVLRLRHERDEARYTQETLVLPAIVAPTALPFPDWNDEPLRWDDTDTELFAVAA